MKSALDRAPARKGPTVQRLFRQISVPAVVRRPQSAYLFRANRVALKYPTVNHSRKPSCGLILSTEAAAPADHSSPYSANSSGPMGAVQSRVNGKEPEEVGI
jgi:hypothetical protein